MSVFIVQLYLFLFMFPSHLLELMVFLPSHLFMNPIRWMAYSHGGHASWCDASFVPALPVVPFDITPAFHVPLVASGLHPRVYSPPAPDPQLPSPVPHILFGSLADPSWRFDHLPGWCWQSLACNQADISPWFPATGPTTESSSWRPGVYHCCTGYFQLFVTITLFFSYLPNWRSLTC